MTYIPNCISMGHNFPINCVGLLTLPLIFLRIKKTLDWFLENNTHLKNRFISYSYDPKFYEIINNMTTIIKDKN